MLELWCSSFRFDSGLCHVLMPPLSLSLYFAVDYKNKNSTIVIKISHVLEIHDHMDSN